MISVKKGQMGGWGSGRHRAGEAKKTTEEYSSLDVRQLQRGCALRPGLEFKCHWTRNGERTASIGVTAAVDWVTLSYQHREPDGEWLSYQYRVPLEWTRCNYGGKRAWFRCPTQVCGRRVAILYVGRFFACRHCNKLAYRSQRLTSSVRALDQAQSIRQRLEGTANMYETFPPRPKGMHSRTYRELRKSYDDANLKSFAESFLSCAARPSSAGHEDLHQSGNSNCSNQTIAERPATSAKDCIIRLTSLEAALVDLIELDLGKAPRLGMTKIRAIELGLRRSGLLVD
jgi:hypothetical protein